MTTEWLPIGVGLGLLLLSNLGARIALDLNVEAFMAVMNKLLLAQNRPRALKILRVVPARSLVPKLVRYAFDLRLPARDPEAETSGYREGTTGRPLDERARELLDAEAAELGRPLLALLPVAVVGPAIVAAGCLAAESVERWQLGLACAGALLLAVWQVRFVLRVRRELREVAGKMAPWVLSDEVPPDA